MKASSTTLFRSLASRIHPQVILTKKESTQFLNSLTASFRHHLDAQHPHDHASASRAKAATPLTLTEKHVVSVLTNPLLTRGPPQVPTGSNGGRHPIDIFETLVAEGSASPATATQCLLSFRRSLRNETPQVRYKAIQKYQPGTKVLKWLWANGHTQSTVFEHDHNLFKAVVYFLVREGRSEAVRDWIGTASTRPFSDGHHQSPKSILLNWLVTCEAKSSRKGLNRALDTFFQVVQSQTGGTLKFAHFAGSQLASLQRLQTATTPSDLKLAMQFLESYPRWQINDQEPVSIDISCLRLRYDPFHAIDDSLGLAKKLNLQHTGSSHALYGERPVQFLVSLSDAIQNVGTQAQAAQFVQLLQSVEMEEKTKEESFFSRAACGIPSMLLREFDKLDFSPRQMAVPA